MKRALTIVEVTGRLGIGGVESHVSRLAAGLVERGHRVVVISQTGGVYGDQARDAGAELLLVPFGSQGLQRASEELAKRDVDIVHAHNYRAARFGAPLARGIARPYVMTVHGPRPWFKRVTFRDWSDLVLTVSDADRDNILGPFGVPADRTVVGFLGVDTNRFKPGIDASSLRAEWAVADDRPLILNVTRFTHRKAKPALALIETMPSVRDRLPGALLVLVGEGDDLDRVQAAADRANRKASDRVVIVAGPRTDIPAVMNAGDVVVATATTAIESSACATPTIAFGRTGYFGIIAPDNYEAARGVCFADHGRLPSPSKERLADDICALLQDKELARENAGHVRALIADRYSVERMVDQIERVYRKAIERHKADV